MFITLRFIQGQMSIAGRTETRVGFGLSSAELPPACILGRARSRANQPGFVRALWHHRGQSF